MKGDLSIPPLRDLPPSRLAQRREHLRSEIVQQPARLPLPRRRLLALVAAALIVVIGAASAIGGVRAFFLDRGFIGVPPEGATPSTPESGDLVLDFYGYSQAHGGAGARVWVYADGRVIWDRRRTDQKTSLPPEGANELISGFLEQRLTPEGVALLRSEVVATGLFDHQSDLFLPDDYGKHPWGSVQVRARGRSILLRWGSRIRGRGQLARPWVAPRSAIAPPEQLSALSQVDALLTDPGSVLPSSAWAERAIRAYVPSHFAVCLYPIAAHFEWAGGKTEPAWPSRLRVLSLLPAPAKHVLEGKSWKEYEFGHPSERTGLVGWPKSCAKVTTAEAREIKTALAGFPQEQRDAGPRDDAYVLGGGRPELAYEALEFEPYLPHGDFIDSVP